jgi:hypothetical protein
LVIFLPLHSQSGQTPRHGHQTSRFDTALNPIDQILTLLGWKLVPKAGWQQSMSLKTPFAVRVAARKRLSLSNSSIASSAMACASVTGLVNPEISSTGRPFADTGRSLVNSPDAAR